MNYLEKIKELSIDIIKSHNVELIDVALRKEFGASIIQITIDDVNTFDLDIDKVALINEEILDIVNDYIPDGYYLEVTTLGIERELKDESDYNKAIGKYVYILTNEKISKMGDSNELYGYLEENNETSLVIKGFVKGAKKTFIIPKENIAKIRLAVKF